MTTKSTPFSVLAVNEGFVFLYGTHFGNTCYKVSPRKYRYPVTDLNGTRWQEHTLTSIKGLEVIPQICIDFPEHL